MTGDEVAPTSATQPAAEVAEATGAQPARLGGGYDRPADGAAVALAEGSAKGNTGAGAAKRGAPWKRRRAVPDPKTRIVTIRFTPEQYAQLSDKANLAANDIGPMIRTMVLGSPGPRAVKRPPIEKQLIAKLLGAIGKLGSNVNQIARALNEGRDGPSREDLAQMRAEIMAMRAAVMAALGRSEEA